MFIGSDDGLPGLQCLPYALVRGVEAAHEFDDYIGIAFEHLVEIIGPLDAIRHPGHALAFDISIEHMGKPQTRFTAEDVGHGTPDCTETQESNVAGGGLRGSLRAQGRVLAGIVDAGNLSA
jgi:hypothetical protein